MKKEWRIVPLSAILVIAAVLALALLLGHDGQMVSVGVGAMAGVATALPIYILARLQNGRDKEEK